MGHKPSPLILAIFVLTLSWFSVRLLFNHHYGKQWLAGIAASSSSSFGKSKPSPPLSFLYSKYYQPSARLLSKIETLFYEFDPNQVYNQETDGTISLSKNEHEKETLKLTEINNQQDTNVKTDGDTMFSFNLLVSNRIGPFRLLPDTRSASCPNGNQKHVDGMQQAATSSEKLQASIVICYYNEAPSALIRTIHSILKRSNPELIKEILIVDDFSEHGYDMDHIKPHIKSDVVKFVRTSKREGLIRARIFGANLTLGEVLIFLDSHVEANVGWLEPLMDTVRESRTTVACPMIDLINAETLLYTSSPMVRGGLSWEMHFKWDSVPSEDLKTKDDFAKPIQTPTMAGGLYAIRRDYFYELGTYDPGMNLWGGENIEMSLRTWMCGGKILILPCSRVGHIFRKTRPYGPEPGEPDSLLYNSRRSAQVWLDEYIDKFYEASPDAITLDTGDVTDRILLRQRLRCNNFTWFLDNVYPKLKVDLEEITEDSNETTTSLPIETSTISSTTTTTTRVNSEL